jgi:hypothetical protein
MMPPICSICREKFSPDTGGLIYFVEDEEDRIGNERLRQPGFTGHPSNAFWFCANHISEANKLQNLQKRVAMKILHEIFGQ